ncbi:MAG: tagaturonate epimerase family protein [Planctomycetota bacterium]|jgi:hypothetical protein
MVLGKYSFGLGDRFGHQGQAQLQAVIKAKSQGLDITPVWNKSHREHMIIKTIPQDVRIEADKAVSQLNWDGSYYIDADHISLKNVDLFLDSSDFFTLDVSEFINRQADEKDIADFVARYKKYTPSVSIPHINQKIHITVGQIEQIARKFLLAAKESGRIYRHIEAAKGHGVFLTEVSMDETDSPQTPVEMLFILAALADEQIPVQTIAPRFTGRFNKGIDYVGDINQFAAEFEQDLAVIVFAIDEFDLPEDLKLSVHSGSDKFSIYEPMRKAIRKFDTGLHLKTAGTTWLEELIGLAYAQGEALEIAKQIYKEALSRFDELCSPYAPVIDINRANLPSLEVIDRCSGDDFAQMLRHDRFCDKYNADFRQLLHVAYKVAAEMGKTYTDALQRYSDVISKGVTENIYSRHIAPLFIE